MPGSGTLITMLVIGASVSEITVKVGFLQETVTRRRQYHPAFMTGLISEGRRRQMEKLGGPSKMTTMSVLNRTANRTRHNASMIGDQAINECSFVTASATIRGRF